MIGRIVMRIGGTRNVRMIGRVMIICGVGVSVGVGVTLAVAVAVGVGVRVGLDVLVAFGVSLTVGDAVGVAGMGEGVSDVPAASVDVS